MISWALMWLYFRVEALIDWGGSGNLVIDWTPSISTSVSMPDHEGFQLRSMGFHFLIIGVTISYNYPALFKYNEEGELVGRNLFPECTITQVD